MEEANLSSNSPAKHEVLAHLNSRGHAWATAKELALELGYPWRSVAEALRRLTCVGQVEQDVCWCRARQNRLDSGFAFRAVATFNDRIEE
jgi:hypothetical protein